MSSSLGEKLRQARETKGFTISEVAEQTRISSQYLEGIENDDYRTLPGGIFNKGFVKSFAKCVGVDEQEALADYASLNAVEQGIQDESRLYRPEVLTDDRSSGSMVPTVVVAAIILAALTGGTLYLLNYLRQPVGPASSGAARSNGNAAVEESSTAPLISDTPDMRTLRVEFRALNAPVSLSVISDGEPTTNKVNPGASVTFEPKTSLKLSYARALASTVELKINGKPITLPAVPIVPRRNSIEFEINEANLSQIWSTGAIPTGAPVAGNANVEAPAGTSTVTRPTATRPRPTATSTPRSNTNANLPRPPPTRTPAPPTRSGTPEEQP